MSKEIDINQRGWRWRNTYSPLYDPDKSTSRWVVVCIDGAITCIMDYLTARAYADVYGGVVKPASE